MLRSGGRGVSLSVLLKQPNRIVLTKWGHGIYDGVVEKMETLGGMAESLIISYGGRPNRGGFGPPA